jgi:L-asparaginase / beta-aspartyl-peptidase
MILVTNNEGTHGIGETTRLLRAGAFTLDAIEAGIRLIEDNEDVWTVGRGGWPNLLGQVELDASMMDGDTLRTATVASLQGFLHPFSIARRIMDLLPHEILVGEGAAMFAREIGAEQGELLLPHAKDAWDRWFERDVSAEEKRNWPNVPLAPLCRHAIDPEIGKDTTVFLAQDSNGSLAVGTSTSGWGWKYPGRLGDCPIIGAGSYADSRYGAAACTGAGEMSIRTGAARSVVLYMKMGMTVEEAVHEAAKDMEGLKGGLITRITIHAIDTKGNHKVVAVNGVENTYWLWEGGDEAPRTCPAEITTLESAVNPRETAAFRFGNQL